MKSWTGSSIFFGRSRMRKEIMSSGTEFERWSKVWDNIDWIYHFILVKINTIIGNTKWSPFKIVCLALVILGNKGSIEVCYSELATGEQTLAFFLPEAPMELLDVLDVAFKVIQLWNLQWHKQ